MVNDNVFLTDYNESSGRYLIIDEDRFTGWAYLTKPFSKEIDIDCWLYNKIKVIDTDITKYKNTPPPIPEKYLKSSFSHLNFVNLNSSDFGITRNEQDNKIFITIFDYTVAMIDVVNHMSYNIFINTECGWGNPMKLS